MEKEVVNISIKQRAQCSAKARCLAKGPCLAKSSVIMFSEGLDVLARAQCLAKV